MKPSLFWLQAPSGRLAIMARPRGGDWLQDELAALRAAGVDMVACTLTAAEMMELDLTGEPATAVQAGLGFVALPIADRGVPSAESALPILRRLLAELRLGRTLAVHCRMGIGRSSMIAASLLVMDGVEVEAAWAEAALARGLNVPDTAEQRAWIRQFVRPAHGEDRA
ncbi:MAG: tyrosine protein phosphatase [Actinomycetota bacterium]